MNYVPPSPNFLHTSDIEPEQETDDEFEAPPDAAGESDDEPDQYDVVADSSLREPPPRRPSHYQLQYSQADRGLSRLPIPPNPIRTWIAPSSGDMHQVSCKLCQKLHKPGECSLRNVELEQCPACGYHHFHLRRTCPLLHDADDIEVMFQRLKESTEDPEVVKGALHYLRGVRANLAMRKRMEKQLTETETS